jgi:hypothetical protein
LAFVEMRQDRGELLGQALNVDSQQGLASDQLILT